MCCVGLLAWPLVSQKAGVTALVEGDTHAPRKPLPGTLAPLQKAHILDLASLEINLKIVTVRAEYGDQI